MSFSYFGPAKAGGKIKRWRKMSNAKNKMSASVTKWFV